MSETRFMVQPVEFGPSKGGMQTKQVTFEVGRPVIRAQAALRGVRAEYTGEAWLHLLVQRISDVNILDDLDRREVRVTVEFGLRDNSGVWDDEFKGAADVLLIYVSDQ